MPWDTHPPAAAAPRRRAALGAHELRMMPKTLLGLGLGLGLGLRLGLGLGVCKAARVFESWRRPRASMLLLMILCPVLRPLELGPICHAHGVAASARMRAAGSLEG